MQFSYYKDGIIYGTVQKLNTDIQWYETYLRAINEKTREIIGEDIRIADEKGGGIWPSYIRPVRDDELAILSSAYVDNHSENDLYIMVRNCTVKGSKNIAEVPGVSEDVIESVMVSEGIYAYLLYDGKLLAFGRELLYKKTVLESISAFMCVGNDGILYILDYLAGGKLSCYDLTRDKLKEDFGTIPGGEYVYDWTGNELLIGSSSSMRSYNTQTHEFVKLFDFTDVGFSSGRTFIKIFFPI